MDSSSYELIVDLVKEMQQEYDDLQKQIDDYDFRIQETDRYIQSFLDKEDKDFKLFSPRNVENIYKDEIERANCDKQKLQQELNKCYHNQNLLRSKMEKLQGIVTDQHEYHLSSDIRKQNMTLLNIQEEDRHRIARDLHDTSLQNLAHLVHKIELCSMFIDQDPLRAKLELSVVSKSLKAVIDEIRNTIFNLRPMSFDDLGLETAFEQLMEVINENRSYETDVNIEKVSCDNDLILTTIYRVVQECLENIVKHAEADKITFHGKNENGLYLIDIEDNGKGFTREEMENKQDRHFGITVMKERISLLGGKIDIDSKKDKGTHIHIEIPLV